jgi:hypothetical protein
MPISAALANSLPKVDVQGPDGAVKAAIAGMTPMIDLLDPESMMAFFSMQMKNVRGQLSTAMKEQQDRNELATSLQKCEARLSVFTEQGIIPGDPRWDDFEAAANEAISLMGGKDGGGSKLADDLAKIKGSGLETKVFGTEADAKAYVKDHGGAVTFLPSPHNKFVVAPAERDAVAIKGIVGELKAYRDGIQSDNAMNMIRVQQLVENSSQLTNMCSNIMKKLSDMAMVSINNLK